MHVYRHGLSYAPRARVPNESLGPSRQRFGTVSPSKVARLRVVVGRVRGVVKTGSQGSYACDGRRGTLELVKVMLRLGRQQHNPREGNG